MATGCSFTFPPSNLWPVGFGFRPTEEEIITHYLYNKILGKESLVQSICELDLYNYEPWELPKQSTFKSDNYEWFFFRPESESSYGHLNKTRTKRTTTTGYWKSTGEDRKIKARGTNKLIGTRKILVFHRGKTPNGIKTKWIIHEYRLHLDDKNLPYPYQRSFVVCRLKENAEEMGVSTCEQDEQNNCVSSYLNKKITDRAISEEVYSKTQHHLIDYQPPNCYNGEVNGQLIQPETITELLNSVDFEDKSFYEVTSKMCIDGYNETNLQSPWDSGPSQPPNEYDGMINRSFPPGASNLTEIFNSGFLEDENSNYNKEEVESMVYELPYGGFSSDTDNDAAFTWPVHGNFINSAFLEDENSDECNQSYNYNKEEGESMVYELQYCGFSSDTDNDAAFTWQNNETSPRWFNEHTSLGVQSQNMATIKESRRSPLTAKRLQFKEEEDISHLYEKCEPKSSDLVPYESVPRRIRLQSKAVSQDKAKEDVQQKSKAVERKGSGFSYILTTKNIHHKSSLPLVYVAKAFLGIIMFIMFAQEVLLYGSWG